MATSAQVSAFIKMIAPIAQEQAKKHGNKIFPSVCIAQACCESAYGTSQKMRNANALFGIKVGKSKCHFGTAWKDKAYSTRTKECYDGKTYTEIVDMFRAYDSVEEAVEDYYDLLCVASRYKYALNQKTPLECIQGIQKAPYATSPTYVNTIMTIITKYNLTQFDEGGVEIKNPYTVPNATMKKGSKGSYVKWLQFELNKRLGICLVVDGIYGYNTVNAVKQFQKANNLEVDGIVGKQTLNKLLT